MNYTDPAQVLFEIEVRDLVKVEKGKHGGLNSAEVRRVWGPLKVAQPGAEPISPNGGFWSEQPRDPEHGSWTYNDWCRAGVFIDGRFEGAVKPAPQDFSSIHGHITRVRRAP
jgi:hypothetical protein